MVRETVLIADTVLTVELHDDLRYVLRYGDLVDRIAFNAPYRADPTAWAETLAGFRSP